MPSKTRTDRESFKRNGRFRNVQITTANAISSSGPGTRRFLGRHADGARSTFVYNLDDVWKLFDRKPRGRLANIAYNEKRPPKKHFFFLRVSVPFVGISANDDSLSNDRLFHRFPRRKRTFSFHARITLPPLTGNYNSKRISIRRSGVLFFFSKYLHRLFVHRGDGPSVFLFSFHPKSVFPPAERLYTAGAKLLSER